MDVKRVGSAWSPDAKTFSVAASATARTQPRPGGNQQLPIEARSTSLVLVIDDDAWIRSIMLELLESDGFSVLEASYGDCGLRHAQEMRPDVILLDLAEQNARMS